MTDMDAMREAFEAWRRSSAKMDPDSAVAREGVGEDATYANRTTRAMWIGWIACAVSQHEDAALSRSDSQ